MICWFDYLFSTLIRHFNLKLVAKEEKHNHYIHMGFFSRRLNDQEQPIVSETHASVRGIKKIKLSQFQTILRQSIINAVKERHAQKVATCTGDNQTKTRPQKSLVVTLPTTKSPGKSSESEISSTSSPSGNDNMTKMEFDIVSSSIRNLISRGKQFCTLANLKEDISNQLQALPDNTRQVLEIQMKNRDYGKVLKEVMEKLQM